MFTFHPFICRDGVLTELPRPILTCRLHDTWDFQKYKVPMLDGEIVTGCSQDGVEIRIEGQIGTLSGTPQLSEQAMFAAVESLRSAAQPLPNSDCFLLALFQTDNGNHRYFRNCTAHRLDIDFSDKHIFSYSLAIHAADPVIHLGTLP